MSVQTNEIVLAADLGGTNLRMAAVGPDGHIHKRVKLKTPDAGRRDAIVSCIVEAASECTSERPGTVLGTVLAVPGTIGTGVVTQAPNLPDLNGFDLSSAVSAELDMPVVIANDANAAAVGENWLGASKGADVSIMITLGTGVGGGIIIDGSVLTGKDGTAGEIGHINVEPDGIECGCGSIGCLEQYASATAIARMAAAAREKNPQFFETQKADPDAGTVFQAANEGACWAKEIFETQGFYLGIAIADLINVLNPDVIVIGGGAAAAWDAFMPTVRKQVNKRAYTEAAARAKIVRAGLADNAGILGAARIGFERRCAVQ